MGKIIFDCGCSFNTVDPTAPDHHVINPIQEFPRCDVDIYQIPFDCTPTWDLLSSGQTKGVFQLEGHLGKIWAKKVKPTSLEDLGALVALIRPGVLRAISKPSIRFCRNGVLKLTQDGDIRNVNIKAGEQFELSKYNKSKNGKIEIHFPTGSELNGKAIVGEDCCNITPAKSMTEQYADRKNLLEEVEYLHPALEPILHKTHGVLVYQESAMQISVSLAGFNEQEADVLRKAMGKKRSDIMAKVQDNFLTGCKATGIVNVEQAEEIFGWVRESQRYSFNKCLSPTTIVETIDGDYKTLDDVEIGAQITSPEGPTTILNKYDNGIQDVFEATLESGKTIQCTMSHQFLCVDGKKYSLSEILEQNLEIVCDMGI